MKIHKEQIKLRAEKEKQEKWCEQEKNLEP
jgi:hypothetical protein